MNDFNRGALQVPCLRLDYGSGEQWASVELGDGTGYVRLGDYEKVVAENAKLKKLCSEMFRDFANADYELKRRHGRTFMAVTRYLDRIRELGIETEQACQNVSYPPEGFLCSECGWGDFDEPTHLLRDAKFCPNCGAKVARRRRDPTHASGTPSACSPRRSRP